MTPISLCLLAPFGSVVGSYISMGLIAFGNVGGFVAVALVAAIWEFLVMSGMHMVIIMFMLTTWMETGVMSGVMNSGMFATWATFGVALGAALRIKNKEEKSMTFGFFASGILGGVTEPTLYGLCFNHKKTFIGLMVGGAVGGAYAGITNVQMYLLGSTNFLSLVGFAGGSLSNTINATIACLLSMVVAAVVTFMFGFSKDEECLKK
jgi:PTS system beta-glucosides-specific IIC component